MKKLAPVITIDGSSGAGKSILCKNIARELKWNALESGFIYRLVSYIILYKKLSIDKKYIHLISKYLDIYLNSKNDIFNDRKLILQDVVNYSSKIAILPHVRKLLLNKQKSFRKFPGLVTNGRDMGTVVFPDAIVKIFLDADINVRAKRRVLELHNNGIDANFDTILFDMQKRDKRDRERFYSPLLVAKDAIIINTTHINIEEVFNTAIKAIFNNLNSA